jgi:hypothetical protein
MAEKDVILVVDGDMELVECPECDGNEGSRRRRGRVGRVPCLQWRRRLLAPCITRE